MSCSLERMFPPMAQASLPLSLSLSLSPFSAHAPRTYIRHLMLALSHHPPPRPPLPPPLALLAHGKQFLQYPKGDNGASQGVGPPPWQGTCCTSRVRARASRAVCGHKARIQPDPQPDLAHGAHGACAQEVGKQCRDAAASGAACQGQEAGGQ